ncbi:MAG: hypothetical protein ACOC8Q_01800, partial [Desulfosalsimonas sp.]
MCQIKKHRQKALIRQGFWYPVSRALYIFIFQKLRMVMRGEEGCSVYVEFRGQLTYLNIRGNKFGVKTGKELRRIEAAGSM